jgi:lysophospholipase L1-like esterase
MHHPRAIWAPAFNRETVGYRGNASGRRAGYIVRLSAQGLRGPDIGARQPGEIRILVTGDSYTFGFGMSEREDFASVLRDELRERSPGNAVSVINCGVTGYGPWQERILMEERGLPLDPDVAILQLYPANDGWNSLEKLGRRLPAYHKAQIEFIEYWRNRTHWVMSSETWLRRHWYSYHIMRTRFRDETISLPELVSRLPFVPRRDRAQSRPPNGRNPMIEQCLVEWYPELQFGWDEMERDILAIQNLCNEHGVPLYAYVVPYPVFDAARWEAETRDSREASGTQVSYEQYRDVRMAEAFLQENGVAWIPLLDPLLAEPDPHAYFLASDGHFNKTGARFVSELILDRLAADGLSASAGNDRSPQNTNRFR